MPTVIPIARNTDPTYGILANKLVIDMKDKILQLQPNKAPLTVLLAKMAKEACSAVKVEWLEDDLQARWSAINNAAGYLSSDVTFIVDNPTYFTAGDIIKIPRTGEVMRVITAAGTSTIVVATRGTAGTTAAAALVDDDPIVIIGNANAENADTPGMKSVQEAAKYNYCQIFRTPFGISKTAMAVKMYGGADLSYTQLKKGIEHSVDIERAMLFGELYSTAGTASVGPIKQMAGVLSFITTNVGDDVGQMEEKDLESFCQTLFAYGSDTKFLFCSGAVLSAINSFARARLQTVPSDKTYGINMTQYLNPHGELMLIKHRLLEGAIYGKMAIALDIANLKYRVLRDTVLNTNTQAPGVDGRIDEYITEATLEVGLEKTHGVIKGVSGY